MIFQSLSSLWRGFWASVKSKLKMKVEQRNAISRQLSFLPGYSLFLPGCLSHHLTIVQPGMAAKFSGELEDLFAGKAKIMVGPEDSGRIIGWMKDFWPPK